jgi:hypothetical protein
VFALIESCYEKKQLMEIIINSGEKVNRNYKWLILKIMRDAGTLQIYEGTNQIQRNVVGQSLIKEAAKKGRKQGCYLS